MHRRGTVYGQTVYYYAYEVTIEYTPIIVYPTVTVNSIEDTIVGSSVTVHAVSSTPCYRMTAKYSVNGGVEQVLSDISNTNTYDTSFILTETGQYTITVYSRSYTETDSKSGVGSSSVTFKVNQP